MTKVGTMEFLTSFFNASVPHILLTSWSTYRYSVPQETSCFGHRKVAKTLEFGSYRTGPWMFYVQSLSKHTLYPKWSGDPPP